MRDESGNLRKQTEPRANNKNAQLHASFASSSKTNNNNTVFSIHKI
jgi:hypothetical protein